MQRWNVLLLTASCMLIWACGADAATVATRGHEHWQKPPLTLEQLAYRFWGARLEQACPNGSLRFHISRRQPVALVDVEGATPAGASWGDCNPWIKRDRRPLMCNAALHEAGHEVGLGHSTDGGVMDPYHEIVGSIAVFARKHGGHARRAQVWTGLPAICKPSAGH